MFYFLASLLHPDSLPQFSVRDFRGPRNLEDAPDALMQASVNLLLIGFGHPPCFAPIEEYSQDIGFQYICILTPYLPQLA